MLKSMQPTWTIPGVNLELIGSKLELTGGNLDLTGSKLDAPWSGSGTRPCVAGINVDLDQELSRNQTGVIQELPP